MIRLPKPLSAMVLVLGLAGCGDATAPQVEAPAPRDTAVAAVHAHSPRAEVEGEGRVLRLLRDDTRGNPHQKFLLRLADGSTVLVAHNTDVAPRLDGLAEGDTVTFRGEYLWNPKGGTLHWTHRDPHGRHPDGWLRWRGRTYD